MPIYQKKPISIKAQKWKKKGDVPSWAYGMVMEFEDSFVIPTPERPLTGVRGDYIVQGIKGEIYCCKGHIFEESYLLVENVAPRIEITITRDGGTIDLGQFILPENEARELLNGNIMKCELGGFDGKRFSHAMIETKK